MYIRYVYVYVYVYKVYIPYNVQIITIYSTYLIIITTYTHTLG